MRTLGLIIRLRVLLFGAFLASALVSVGARAAEHEHLAFLFSPESLMSASDRSLPNGATVGQSLLDGQTVASIFENKATFSGLYSQLGIPEAALAGVAETDTLRTAFTKITGYLSAHGSGAWLQKLGSTPEAFFAQSMRTSLWAESPALAGSPGFVTRSGIYQSVEKIRGYSLEAALKETRFPPEVRARVFTDYLKSLPPMERGRVVASVPVDIAESPEGQAVLRIVKTNAARQGLGEVSFLVSVPRSRLKNVAADLELVRKSGGLYSGIDVSGSLREDGLNGAAPPSPPSGPRPNKNSPGYEDWMKRKAAYDAYTKAHKAGPVPESVQKYKDAMDATFKDAMTAGSANKEVRLHIFEAITQEQIAKDEFYNGLLQSLKGMPDGSLKNAGVRLRIGHIRELDFKNPFTKELMDQIARVAGRENVIIEANIVSNGFLRGTQAAESAARIEAAVNRGWKVVLGSDGIGAFAPSPAGPPARGAAYNLWESVAELAGARNAQGQYILSRDQLLSVLDETSRNGRQLPMTNGSQRDLLKGEIDYLRAHSPAGCTVPH